MNLNQRMEALERKIDLLLSLNNVEANPGTSTEQGRTFAPGSGPIAEYKPPAETVRCDPSPFIAAARAAVHATPTDPAKDPR